MEKTTTPEPDARRQLEAARAENNRLRTAIYQHPGENTRTLATVADIDNLLADARRTLLALLASGGTIHNATLIFQSDI